MCLVALNFAVSDSRLLWCVPAPCSPPNLPVAPLTSRRPLKAEPARFGKADVLIHTRLNSRPVTRRRYPGSHLAHRNMTTCHVEKVHATHLMPGPVQGVGAVLHHINAAPTLQRQTFSD